MIRRAVLGVLGGMLAALALSGAEAAAVDFRWLESSYPLGTAGFDSVGFLVSPPHLVLRDFDGDGHIEDLRKP